VLNVIESIMDNLRFMLKSGFMIILVLVVFLVLADHYFGVGYE